MNISTTWGRQGKNCSAKTNSELCDKGVKFRKLEAGWKSMRETSPQSNKHKYRKFTHDKCCRGNCHKRSIYFHITSALTLIFTLKELIKFLEEWRELCTVIFMLECRTDYLILFYELHSSVLYCKYRCGTLLPQYLCQKNACILVYIVNRKRDWELLI